LWIVQPLLELGAECLGSDLCCNCDFTGCRIGGHELDFIDLDGCAFAFAEGLANLLGNVLSLRPADGESAHEAREIVNGDLIGKVDAGEARSGQQLRESALSLAGFERDAIEKKFRA